jgi:hypothetical protein
LVNGRAVAGDHAALLEPAKTLAGRTGAEVYLRCEVLQRDPTILNHRGEDSAVKIVHLR